MMDKPRHRQRRQRGQQLERRRKWGQVWLEVVDRLTSIKVTQAQLNESEHGGDMVAF